MAWQSYKLDRYAHDLVLEYCQHSEATNQAYKMRMTVAYGLERFWGESLRLAREDKDKTKGAYWKATWEALVKIMATAGVQIPNDKVDVNNHQQIKQMAEKLWHFDAKQRKVAIAVLTQLCDSMVWWTQRYKNLGGNP